MSQDEFDPMNPAEDGSAEDAVHAEWSASGHVLEDSIYAWLDDALGDDDSARVAAHVAACAECSAAVAEARGFIAASARIIGSLDISPRAIVPADDVARTAQNIIALADVRSTSANAAANAAANADVGVTADANSVASTQATGNGSRTLHTPWHKRSALRVAAGVVLMAGGASYVALRSGTAPNASKFVEPASALVAAAPPAPSAPPDAAKAAPSATTMPAPSQPAVVGTVAAASDAAVSARRSLVDTVAAKPTLTQSIERAAKRVAEATAAATQGSTALATADAATAKSAPATEARVNNVNASGASTNGSVTNVAATTTAAASIPSQGSAATGASTNATTDATARSLASGRGVAGGRARGDASADEVAGGSSAGVARRDSSKTETLAPMHVTAVVPPPRKELGFTTAPVAAPQTPAPLAMELANMRCLMPDASFAGTATAFHALLGTLGAPGSYALTIADWPTAGESTRGSFTLGADGKLVGSAARAVAARDAAVTPSIAFDLTFDRGAWSGTMREQRNGAERASRIRLIVESRAERCGGNE